MAKKDNEQQLQIGALEFRVKIIGKACNITEVLLNMFNVGHVECLMLLIAM